MPKKFSYSIFHRFCAGVLIILHLVTFGPAREALAFNAASDNYKLNSGSMNEGGKERSGASAKLWQDVIGEPSIGTAQSANFILNSGLLPTIQTNQPILTQNIPYQSWEINTTKESAFDLDDYFSSPDDLALTFSVIGNNKINVTIDPDTHLVSFSQTVDWSGVEKVYFKAADAEGNSFQSNEVSLQVINSAAGQANKPVIVEALITPNPIKEGDLIKITIKAVDPDNQDLSFTYSDFFSETHKYKQGNLWVSEANWLTPANAQGHYTVRVTVTDPASLSDTKPVVVNISGFNHTPVLEDIPDIVTNEGELVTILPVATDSDNDPLVFYYSAPFDTQGKWLTGYDDSGTRSIRVTASDGIDTITKTANVIINNTNRAPQVNLSLSHYTAKPGQEISIYLAATDPDADVMTFTLKKDDVEIVSGNFTGSYNGSTAFSDLGDHNISATITDANGLSATDAKGVDVADPNANRDAINPVMGDFNGDALTDLGLHNSDSGTWEICLSDKGVFRNAVSWLNSFGTSRDWWPIGGDFNGDAKTDIGIYNNTTGELKMALSSGSGFSESGTWLNFPDASYSWQPFTGNFNADKYTDFALYNTETGEVKVALGTGTGFMEPTAWLTEAGNGYIALSGDFNADGLSDLGLFKKSSGEFKVYFSNSKAFVDGTSWISGYGTDKDILVSDFNNDSLSDIGYWDKDSGKWYYAISTGDRFIDKGLWLDGFGNSSDESATTGDFDGNGLTDAACFDKDQLGINRWKTHLSINKPADLLIEIDNGIGGKTQINYTYAATSDNPGLPFPVYVASRISLINNFPAERAATYTQNFVFSGGYFDTADREFRGFNKVKAIDPITNNYSETYFYQGKPGQDGALKGQIDKVIAYDGNSRKISESTNTYEVKKAGPETNFLGFPGLKEQNTTVYEENGSSLSTKNTFTYDNIGNLTEEVSLGDASKAGDEKSTATTYAQAYEYNATNNSGFNRPLESVLKDKDGNIVTQKNFEYDTKGNLAKEKVAIFNPLTSDYGLSTTDYAYDDYGNLTSTTNALGKSVATEYETDFYTYPAKVTNSLGHAIKYVYEPKFGVVKSVTDTNGNTSTTTYDTFGRPTQVKNAYDQVVTTYTYPDFNTKTTTNPAGLFKTEYVDGLGRKYKAVSSGEDGVNSRDISSEIFFNTRGLKESESLAHYVGEDPAQISYIRYEYDLRGRVKRTISDFPGTTSDAEALVNYISPLYTETTDPLGHRKGTLKDVYGNILEVTEFTSDGVFKTKYEYDIQNNLTKTTDDQNNVAQIFYDSIGRKLKMIDPDMGTWTYEYDLVGNLKKQTDAKGQILEFEYDNLNRLTHKLSNSQTLVTYSYDDEAKENCIGRLSKIIDLSGSTEFFYDKLGREIKSIKTVDGTPYTVERAYDILDRLVTLKYPDGETVSYTYDPHSGLLEGVSGVQNYTQDMSYNAKGQAKNILYGNNVTTDYTYGPDLRLSRISTIAPSVVNLQDLRYTFDHNGNLTTLTDNLRNNTRTYTYDGLDRLTRAQNVPNPAGGYTEFNYQHDSIGNMTYKSDVGVMGYGVNAGPHALTSAGGYAYQYDANGNMVVGKNKALAYDVENRLLNVTESGVTTSFVYDGDGGRVKKTTGSDSTIYIGSLYEKDASGKLTKHIFAGANRVASVESTGNIYYYHGDHLGSSNVITNQTGQQVQYCEYTPYGTLARNEGTDLVAHKFTGKELDRTGLYFYGARYYDPEIGRFITADTIVQAPYNPQTLNRYSYCGNNPINYVDPTGHFFWFIPMIIGIAVKAAAAAVSAVAVYLAANAAAIATGALVGGAIGGVSSVAMGGDFWSGALTGAIGGAVFAGIAPGLNALTNSLARTITLGGAAGPLTQGATMASNFASSFLAGAASGAAVAGMTGANVGNTALMGGAIAGGFSLGRDTALWMRARMIKQSRLDPRNASGKSVGFNGDNFKLGGARYDQVHPNGNSSPLGGAQGGAGQIFGMPYNPGSIFDRIVETYAGPHDYLNSWGYDLFGNLKNQSGFESVLGKTLNPLNVVIATPIALSSIVPHAAYAAPSVIYGEYCVNDQ